MDPTPNETEEAKEEKLTNAEEITEAKVVSFDFSQPPKELSRTEFPAFTRGCKWSPDGLCNLVNCDNNYLSLFDYSNEELKEAFKVKEGESVYDFQWYPLMSSVSPDTCVFATTSQYQPIHLYDAFDGHIRATYRCFDHLDEMTAARSLCFNPSGTKLLAGLKNQIRIFDVAIPGRDCETVKLFDKKEGQGLSGIISAMAFNPVMEQVFALASYDKSLAIYLDPRAQLLCQMDGQKGGITHLKFTPDGTKLLAGGRKDNEILVWDMRKQELLMILERKVDTNQRVYFDIDPSGKYAMSGSTDGSMTIWDLDKTSDNIVAHLEHLHDDCINGISIHPWLPTVSTCSGQRHVSYPKLDEEEEDDPEETTQEDFSLKLWSFKHHEEKQ